MKLTASARRCFALQLAQEKYQYSENEDGTANILNDAGMIKYPSSGDGIINLRVKIPGEKYTTLVTAGQFVWYLFHEDDPNSDPLNVHINNLIKSQDTSGRVPYSNNSSGVTGIKRVKNDRFRGYVTFDGSNHYAGTFLTIEEAIEGRVLKLESLRKEACV